MKKSLCITAAIMAIGAIIGCSNEVGGIKEDSPTGGTASVSPWNDSHDKLHTVVFEGPRGVDAVGYNSAGSAEEQRGVAFYRIPALYTGSNGWLYAFADKRYGSNMDTGYNLVGTSNKQDWADAVSGATRKITGQVNNASGRPVDIVMRVSKDGGITWGEETVVAAGDGQWNGKPKPEPVLGQEVEGAQFAGHCDPVPVVDRENPNNILVLTCSGSSNYSNTNGPNFILQFRSTNGGKSWTQEDISRQIDTETEVSGQRFFSAGRALQSAYKFNGSQYYRVYAHITVGATMGYLMYTDDFGVTWKLLGEGKTEIFDESKIHELDKNHLLVTSKKKNFVIYTLDETGSSVEKFSNISNTTISGVACNGDVIVVQAKNQSGQTVDLALSSFPQGGNVNYSELNSLGMTTRTSSGSFNRWNIGIKWKELCPSEEIPQIDQFSGTWEGPYKLQGDENIEGGYSVMQELPNGNIGIIYEEGPDTRANIRDMEPDPVAKVGRPFVGYAYGDWHIIKYQELSLETITSGQYTLVK